VKNTIITCDVCKEEKKCESVTLSFQSSSYGGKSKTYDVCRECCIKANLVDEKYNFQYDYPKTDAETLFELIGEIARNAVSQ